MHKNTVDATTNLKSAVAVLPAGAVLILQLDFLWRPRVSQLHRIYPGSAIQSQMPGYSERLLCLIS